MSAPLQRDITQERVKELFEYRENGQLIWRERPKPFRLAGKIAGSEQHGYLKVQIGDNTYGIHNIVWLYHCGIWPKFELDHIDRNGLNNRIENLREVTYYQNNLNRNKIQRNNTSGVVGVKWSKANKKWNAGITVDGKHKHLGYFANKDDAIAERKAAEQKYHAEYSPRSNIIKPLDIFC